MSTPGQEPALCAYQEYDENGLACFDKQDNFMQSSLANNIDNTWSSLADVYNTIQWSSLVDNSIQSSLVDKKPIFNSNRVDFVEDPTMSCIVREAARAINSSVIETEMYFITNGYCVQNDYIHGLYLENNTMTRFFRQWKTSLTRMRVFDVYFKYVAFVQNVLNCETPGVTYDAEDIEVFAAFCNIIFEKCGLPRATQLTRNHIAAISV